jgi:hypothetical protein
MAQHIMEESLINNSKNKIIQKGGSLKIKIFC